MCVCVSVIPPIFLQIKQRPSVFLCATECALFSGNEKQNSEVKISTKELLYVFVFLCVRKRERLFVCAANTYKHIVRKASSVSSM